jgi:predicted transcriptional regulator
METTRTKKGVTYRMSLDLIRDIKKYAAGRDEYPAAVVERAVRQYLDRQATRKRAALTPAK